MKEIKVFALTSPIQHLENLNSILDGKMRKQKRHSDWKELMLPDLKIYFETES